MTKEKLMEMGLTEEQATKVMEGLNGAFVPKSRFNEVNEELKTAKATITERDGQLDTLKKSGADAATLQAQITQLQADNAQKDKDHAAEIKKIKVDNAVKEALLQAGAINPATVTPLLAAFLEKADLADDGTIRGLSDEISKLASMKPLSHHRTGLTYDWQKKKKHLQIMPIFMPVITPISVVIGIMEIMQGLSSSM